MKPQAFAIALIVTLATGCATEPEDTAGFSEANGTSLTEQDEAIVIHTPTSSSKSQAPGKARHEETRQPGLLADAYLTLPSARPAGRSVGVTPGIRFAQESLYREQYRHPGDNGVLRVDQYPVSTLSIDVDTGAYSNMRRWLNQGQWPPENAVRVEEFINYFDYAYPMPEGRSSTFAIDTEIAPTPWNERTHLLRVGIQGYDVEPEQLPAANLVFLVDVSGSMQSADKLPLLRNALALLVNQLGPEDCISLVVYAGASGVVLPPTPGDQKTQITSALQGLEAGGSTNGAAGIELAYQLARENFRPNGVNRVILATDGDFNVGLASTEELVDLVQRQRRSGIALTTLGFGSGNYNDHLMEQLADEGNGHYAYIDRLSEAHKVLSEEMSSTLLTIAGDVKIQIEFNPAAVAEYRLIGYENRLLDEADFENDRVDAGEVGAGHRVTALYEISLTGSGFQRLPQRRYEPNRARESSGIDSSSHPAELAHLRIRYKAPGSSRSRLIATPVLRSHILPSAAQADNDFRFAAAVAAFGQKLRGGQYLEDWSWAEIASLAAGARGPDPFGHRGEFLQLVALADTLATPERVSQLDSQD